MFNNKLPFAPYKTLVLGLLHHHLLDCVDYLQIHDVLVSDLLHKCGICVYLLKDMKFVTSDNVLLSLDEDKRNFLILQISDYVYSLKELPANSLKDLILDYSF